jgi:hypothetical protein
MIKLGHGEEAAAKPKFVKYKMSPPLSAEFENGSKIYSIGFETILGRKASMFLIDEASEVGYKAFSKLTTRLSKNNNARKIDPTDSDPLHTPQFFKSLQMNPDDNLDNRPPDYLNNLENLSKEERERFLYGNFSTSAEGAIYEEQLPVAQEDGRISNLSFLSLSHTYCFGYWMG